jgi:hypothetical protein
LRSIKFNNCEASNSTIAKHQIVLEIRRGGRSIKFQIATGINLKKYEKSIYRIIDISNVFFEGAAHRRTRSV